jgi:hypothetical protein
MSERDDYADHPDLPPSWLITKVVYPLLGLLVVFTLIAVFVGVCLLVDGGWRQMVGPTHEK